jgi:outer membrane protein assembly factor BamE (lipoprotein component of BamABCDE complex)
MNKTLTAVALALAVPALSGCVVAVGDVKADRESDWQELERDNRNMIARLETGMSIETVRSRLGTPEFSESLEVDGGQYSVLFYRTQRREADGMTTRDETTPLIFRDGMLVGWGEAAWTDLTGRPLG